MARALSPFRLILLYVLTALLFSGCQTTAPTQTPRRSVTGQPAAAAPQAEKATEIDVARQATAAADYSRAVQQFEQHLKKNAELPEPAYYEYGLALSRTNQYDKAIEQLNYYLENVGRHGNNFYPALEERNRAQENRAKKAELEAQIAAKEKALSQSSGSLEHSWQQVQEQLASRPATLVEPTTGMEMILVEGGCFQMGDRFGAGRESERLVQQICVKDFYLGKYEVTQGQWSKLMGYNPAESSTGDNFPVETVNWTQAVEFTKKLGGAQGGYRLPTEAEWEYAARSGGLKQVYSGGDQVNEVAWHEDNSSGTSQPVGQKQPNGLGLYDMSGNVYEWCIDSVSVTNYVTQEDLEEPVAVIHEEKVRRGGSWDSEPLYSRTAYRSPREPEYRSAYTGFRLALPAPAAGQ